MEAPTTFCCTQGENNINKENIKEKITGSAPISVPATNDQPVDLYGDQPTSMNKNSDLPPASNDVPDKMNKYTSMAPNNNLLESSDHAANISWHRKEVGDGTIIRQLEDVVVFLPLSHV